MVCFGCSYSIVVGRGKLFPQGEEFCRACLVVHVGVCRPLGGVRWLFVWYYQLGLNLRDRHFDRGWLRVALLSAHVAEESEEEEEESEESEDEVSVDCLGWRATKSEVCGTEGLVVSV